MDKFDTTWLAAIKVGDEVYIEGDNSYSHGTIARITNTMIVVQYTRTPNAQIRFRKDGHQIAGDTYHHKFLIQATNELKAKIAKANRRYRLIKAVEAAIAKSDDLTTEDIEAAAKALGWKE